MKKTINIGKNIANLRKEKKKTAEQLAEALGVSRQTVSKWENGETVPDAYFMADMATFFDVPIADIYVQTFAGEKKKNKLGMGTDDIEYINNIINPRNVEKAIIAYDRNPNKLKVKIGVNVIYYRDILLLAMGMGCYYRGYSELDNPVSYQHMKDEKRTMPDYVQFLKNEGFIVFYADCGFLTDESIIESDHLEAPEGSSMLVILRNEKELLQYKKCARRFFSGLDDEECKRDWGSSSEMKYLLGARFYDRDIYGLDDSFSSIENSFSDKERKEYRTKLDKIWEDEIENCFPIQYIKDDDELDSVKRQLESLNKRTLEEYVYACAADRTRVDSIVVVDLKTRRFRPLFEK